MFCSEHLPFGESAALQHCVNVCLLVLNTLRLHPDWGSLVTVWCTRTSVRRKPAGGSEQRWRKTQLVARTSGHSSRYRWTAGERASSRDARDILVSELHLVGSLECRSQGAWGKKRAAKYIGESGSSFIPECTERNLPRSSSDYCA